MAIDKIEIMGAVLELPAKQHCQFSPFEVNGLDWHCCLAGSSKTAPSILIFSIVMVADYSFDVKNIDIWKLAFFENNNSFIVTMFPCWSGAEIKWPTHNPQTSLIWFKKIRNRP